MEAMLMSCLYLVLKLEDLFLVINGRTGYLYSNIKNLSKIILLKNNKKILKNLGLMPDLIKKTLNLKNINLLNKIIEKLINEKILT